MLFFYLSCFTIDYRSVDGGYAEFIWIFTKKQHPQLDKMKSESNAQLRTHSSKRTNWLHTFKIALKTLEILVCEFLGTNWTANDTNECRKTTQTKTIISHEKLRGWTPTLFYSCLSTGKFAQLSTNVKWKSRTQMEQSFPKWSRFFAFLDP